jgi:hypothetical protein
VECSEGILETYKHDLTTNAVSRRQSGLRGMPLAHDSIIYRNKEGGRPTYFKAELVRGGLKRGETILPKEAQALYSSYNENLASTMNSRHYWCMNK